jgi:hypothetical protein
VTDTDTYRELAKLRKDLCTARHAIVELDDALTALRAEVAKLTGEADKPGPAASAHAEQANPVTVEAAELAVPGTGLANPAHFVQYAVRTPDRIQVYGDQSWVKHGTAAAGHPDGGADTVVRDIRVSYSPWRTYKAGETEADRPASRQPLRQFTPWELADGAIGLFLEYRDVHGQDEADARRAAALEVAQGAAVTDDDLAPDEPDEPGWNPGDEVDDQGGASEHPHLVTEDDRERG